jgi:dihydrolipoamide dehydrogenase
MPEGAVVMNEHDVVIIGGGPGGYAAAVRANRLGLSSALVENELLGGTCVNWGCVPAKTLLHYAKVRRSQPTDREGTTPIEYSAARDKSLKIATERRGKIEALLRECQVALYTGRAHLASNTEVQIHETGEKLVGKNIIIATGSTPRRFSGLACDGVGIINTRDALGLSEAPASAIVVGSGASGMEFATIWNSFGTKVTVLELMPHILGTDDSEISAEAEAHFRRAGMHIRTGVTVQSMVNTAAGVEVTFSGPSGEETLIADKVLMATGVVPNSDSLGLEAVEVGTDGGGYIKIDRQMRTSIPGIYAVGDVTGKLPLAFAASEQAMIAVEAIAGHETTDLSYENIPRCVHSDIEMAAVGLTEKQAREGGYEVTTIKEPLLPYAKVMTSSRSEGFIKLVAEAGTQKVLGATMLGSDATDQIAIPARMISLGATASELINAVRNGR